MIGSGSGVGHLTDFRAGRGISLRRAFYFQVLLQLIATEKVRFAVSANR